MGLHFAPYLWIYGLIYDVDVYYSKGFACEKGIGFGAISGVSHNYVTGETCHSIKWGI